MNSEEVQVSYIKVFAIAQEKKEGHVFLSSSLLILLPLL
jgi:hypothetical protein